MYWTYKDHQNSRVLGPPQVKATPASNRQLVLLTVPDPSLLTIFSLKGCPRLLTLLYPCFPPPHPSGSLYLNLPLPAPMTDEAPPPGAHLRLQRQGHLLPPAATVTTNPPSSRRREMSFLNLWRVSGCLVWIMAIDTISHSVRLALGSLPLSLPPATLCPPT